VIFTKLGSGKESWVSTAKGKSWGVDRKTSIYVHNYKPSSMQWCQCHKCFTTYCTHCLIAFPFSQTPHLKACQENKRERFLPRDAMHSADYAVERCLSVCSSSTHRYAVKTDKHIIELFSSSGISTPFYSFSTTKLIAIFQREFPNDDVKCKGYEKIAIFY